MDGNYNKQRREKSNYFNRAILRGFFMFLIVILMSVSIVSAFQFDNSVGHGLVADAHVRYEMYTSVEAKLQFYLEMLDKITDGGMEMGTINIFMAGTGVGKSLVIFNQYTAESFS